MPLYVYECTDDDCDTAVEVFLPIHDRNKNRYHYHGDEDTSWLMKRRIGNVTRFHIEGKAYKSWVPIDRGDL